MRSLARDLSQPPMMRTFPIQKYAILHQAKENKELRGGVQNVHRTSDSAV